MSNLQAIDEEGLIELGQDGTEAQAPTCPEPYGIKDNIMNSKLLYVATLAVSLLGGLAVASAPTHTGSQALFTRASSS